MIFNIYIANHGKRDGIEDFITILSGAIQRQGHEVTVGHELNVENINIVIDEFTNAIRNEEISAFKQQNPGAKLVLVLTEFVEQRLLVTSFNFFGGLMDAAVIAALAVYLRLRRKDFNPPTFGDWLTAAIYAPVGALYFLNHLRKNLRRRSRKGLSDRIHLLGYMQMRYLGLEKMIACADGLILSHDMIADGIKKQAKGIPVLGTLYPEIQAEEIRRNLFKDKQLFVEITGSVTHYRHQFILRINRLIDLLGLKHCFRYCKAISFEAIKDPDAPRGAYSLHPPQTKRWKYASPTRIYRALQYDHNMPVLTRVFGQHPIEKLCLEFKEDDNETLLDMYRYYKNPETLLERLEPLMAEYTETAARANETVVAGMLAGTKEQAP